MHLLTDFARALLARCTPETIAFLGSLQLVAPPADANGSEPIFYVDKMPEMPVGAKPRYRWLEASFDEATRRAIDAWRANFEAASKVTYEESSKPDPHATILFAHCPVAEGSICAVFDAMPRHAFSFGYVKALGRPGHEDCWVAVIDDAAILGWMQAARDDASLNCKHPAYVVAGNWPAVVDDFPGPPIPHATLVRDLKDINMNALPPALGVLAPQRYSAGHLVGGTEFVCFEMPGNDGKPVKIKLAKGYA